jgi:hypothetical protein
MKLKTFWMVGLMLAGCAGFERGCSSTMAGSFGADWIVVQFDTAGHPFNCWVLQNTSISNEDHSDGIYWLEPSGNLVHLSGWYNRVQVSNGAWVKAAKSLGVDKDACRDGKYVAP